MEVPYVGRAEGLTGLGADRVTAAVHLGLVGVRQGALVTRLVCRAKEVQESSLHFFAFSPFVNIKWLLFYNQVCV